jgi:hypothetical protein
MACLIPRARKDPTRTLFRLSEPQRPEILFLSCPILFAARLSGVALGICMMVLRPRSAGVALSTVCPLTCAEARICT